MSLSISPHGFCQARSAFFARTGRAVLFAFGEKPQLGINHFFVKRSGFSLSLQARLFVKRQRFFIFLI